jgi:alpha-1,2-mannosyltransferase
MLTPIRLIAAHNSAGPKLDIVVNEGGHQTGFLATSVAEFADAMCRVVTMPADERIEIARAARVRAARFSESKFDLAFKEATSPTLEEAMRCFGIISG